MKKIKILIVDDEKEIVSILKRYLEENGYTILTAYDGSDALPMIMKKPDLILLDIMMPGIDGINFCKKVRDIVDCPILFLTSKENEDDKVEAFGAGGDDYIVKPFGLKELKARIEAHLKRQSRISNSEKNYLIFDELIIDIKNNTVKLKEEDLLLTSTEFDILKLLAVNPGMVFSKEQIFEKIWGFDENSEPATINTHIKNIRHKMEKIDPDAKYIETVWGVGYRWQK